MTTLIPKVDLKNGGTTPAGAVNRPINQKLAESVSVKDFGAIGDGTADDTTAIQAAINACITSGASLYFPAGTYNYTSSSTFNIDLLTPYHEFKMYGDGNTSIIKLNANNKIFNVSCERFAPFNCNGIRFELVNPTTNNNATFFYFSNTINWGCVFVFEDCEFIYPTYAGIHGIRAFNSIIRNCWFYGNSAYTSSSGLLTTYNDAGVRLWGADGTLTVQEHSFSNLCRIENTAFDKLRYGIDGWNMYHSSVVNSTFENVYIGASIARNPSYTQGGQISSAEKGGYGSSQVSFDTCWFEQAALYYMTNIDINVTTGLPVAGAINSTISQIDGGAANYPPTPDSKTLVTASFPPTQAYSGIQFLSGVISDYEVGTWTPILNVGSTVNSVASATGNYVKTGNNIFVSFTLYQASFTPSGTGNVTITGLPFAATSTGPGGGVGHTGYGTLTHASSGGQISASTITLFKTSDGNPFTNSDFGSGFLYEQYSGTYIAA